MNAMLIISTDGSLIVTILSFVCPQVLDEVKPCISFSGENPLRSLLVKQTPYEPDHVWAANSYAIGIDNSAKRTNKDINEA